MISDMEQPLPRSRESLLAEIEKLLKKNIGLRQQAECDKAEIDRLKTEKEMLHKAADADGFHRVLAAREAEIERLNGVIKRGRLCDPRYCTFGNEKLVLREKWQEARCPRTQSGVCLANCEAGCLCQNGIDAIIRHSLETGP